MPGIRHAVPGDPGQSAESGPQAAGLAVLLVLRQREPGAALRLDLPPETHRAVEANRADEARHLADVDRADVDRLLEAPPSGLFRDAPRAPLWDALAMTALLGVWLALLGAALAYAARGAGARRRCRVPLSVAPRRQGSRLS